MNTNTQAPEWIEEVATKLVPLLSGNAQFVLKADDVATFGESYKGDAMNVLFSNTESIKTVRFETDGQTEDHTPLQFADGWVKQRRVRDWRYVLVENAVRSGETQKLVQTLYVQSPELFKALCRALGRNPHGR